MSIEDTLGLMIPLIYLLMLLTEGWLSGRTFPKIAGWKVIGLLFVVLIMTVNIVTPLLLPIEWMRQYRLFNGEALGIAGGTLVGYLAVSFVQYFFHRAEHRVPFIWRWVHQLHHSPLRVDISGSAYAHPLESIIATLYSLAILIFILGLHPIAVALTGLVGAFYSMFQHWNIQTPTWLGYLIQRPEAHCLHHDRHKIQYNYGDLPLWDLLFGTFRNPPTFEGEVGFAPEIPSKVWPMLLGVDVHQAARSLSPNPQMSQ